MTSSNNNNIPKPNIPFGLVRTGEGLESLASTNEFYIEQLPYLSGNKYKSRYLVRNHSTKECLYYVEDIYVRYEISWESLRYYNFGVFDKNNRMIFKTVPRGDNINAAKCYNPCGFMCCMPSYCCIDETMEIQSVEGAGDTKLGSLRLEKQPVPFWPWNAQVNRICDDKGEPFLKYEDPTYSTLNTEIDFPITDMNGKPAAHIRKLYMGKETELNTDMDDFRLTCQMPLSPEAKANLLGLIFFLDKRMFNKSEKERRMQRQEAARPVRRLEHPL